MMNPVVLIKTVGGEYFIGENYTINNNEATSVTIKNARVISMQMTSRGPAMTLVPIVPFVIKDIESIEIAKVNILTMVPEDNIQKDLVNGYKSQITGIQTVSKPGIII